MFTISADEWEFQSTPSVWRETNGNLTCRFAGRISIHSLRMEGDEIVCKSCVCAMISIHSLRMEGDRNLDNQTIGIRLFQSTPSVWRETAYWIAG